MQSLALSIYTQKLHGSWQCLCPDWYTNNHNCSVLLVSTGVEFRVTEEYDEDSPFSRPPNWRPPAPQQDPPPAADEAAVPDQSMNQSDSSPQSSPTDPSGDPSMADTTGNGFQPADGGSHAPTDRTGSEPEAEAVRQHMSETQDHLQASAPPSEADPQTAPSVGRGQVYSKEADTPEELPAHIEAFSQPDADQPVSTEQMDAVHKKPGVRRTLDGSGEAAPDRDAGQQGLLSQPQAAQGETPQGDPSRESEGGDQGRPWWEMAVASATAAAASVTTTVYGAADSVKGAVSAGYEAVTNSQSDQQSGEHLLPALSVGAWVQTCCCFDCITARASCLYSSCRSQGRCCMSCAFLLWRSLMGKGNMLLNAWGKALRKTGAVSHLSKHVCMVTCCVDCCLVLFLA